MERRLISPLPVLEDMSSETGMEERRKKRKKQSTFPAAEHVESETFHELVEALNELEREGKYVDVQICPRCKSPRVRRVGTMSGNLWGHMGIHPHRFECKECGWSDRLVLKATNRHTSIKDAEIIAEASDLERGIDTESQPDAGSSVLS